MHEDVVAFYSFDNKLPVNITLAGITYCDASYKIMRRCSDIYIFEYIIKGQGTLYNNGVTYHPKQGDVYLLKKGDRHTYFPDPEDPWIKIWVNFKSDMIGAMLQEYHLTDVTLIPDLPCLDLFQAIFNITRTETTYARKCYLTAIKLHEIINRVAMRVYPEEKRPDEAIIIRSMLDRSLENKVTLEELAEEAHLSPSQVIRVFKKAYNQTPYQYLIHARLETAKLLLIHSEMTIKQIAYKLRFADEHYFSNYFKQIFGEPPKSFREKNTNRMD